MVVILYFPFSGDNLFFIFTAAALCSGSLFITLSIFNSAEFLFLEKLLAHLLLALLVGIYLIPGMGQNQLFFGQSPEYLSEVTGTALSDTRELEGGNRIFTLGLQYVKNIDGCKTNAHGSVTVILKADIYKGEHVEIVKKNILFNKRDTIFSGSRGVDRTGSFTGDFYKYRAYILEYLKKRQGNIASDLSSFFSSLFLGIRSNPDGEIYNDLRKAGAAHILALSGLHLGIIAFGVISVTRRLFGRNLSFVLTSVVCFLYVFLVGFTPSLTRALLLLFLAGLFRVTGRKRDLFHILVLCFLAQVIIFPGTAELLSFKLSYLALGGIILWSHSLSRLFPGVIPPAVRSVLGASLAAQISTLGIILDYFGVVYPVGIVSGIFLVPLITLFIWTGIGLLLPVPFFIRSIILFGFQKSYLIISKLAALFSLFPGFHLREVIITVWAVCLFYLLKKIFIFFILRDGGPSAGK